MMDRHSGTIPLGWAQVGSHEIQRANIVLISIRLAFLFPLPHTLPIAPHGWNRQDGRWLPSIYYIPLCPYFVRRLTSGILPSV